MAKVDTVVIGASAGGVEALTRIVSMLPKDLQASVLVVIHFPEQSTSALPAILERNGPLKAVQAQGGEVLELGTIYCARPGHHLLLRGDQISLVRGPKENANRPAIDPLFRTAAASRSTRVIGVLLSGLLDDGTVGTLAIQRFGGTTICQKPTDSLFGDMPQHAIDAGGASQVLPLNEIGAAIANLVGRDAPEPLSIETMPDPTEMSLTELADLERHGHPSRFVCPECQGTLFELAQEGVRQFRCRVGHSYLPHSLSASQEVVLEDALWTALRAIEEHNDLLQSLLSSAENRKLENSAKIYRLKLTEGAGRLDLLQAALGMMRTPDQESAIEGS